MRVCVRSYTYTVYIWIEFYLAKIFYFSFTCIGYVRKRMFGWINGGMMLMWICDVFVSLKKKNKENINFKEKATVSKYNGKRRKGITMKWVGEVEKGRKKNKTQRKIIRCSTKERGEWMKEKKWKKGYFYSQFFVSRIRPFVT